MAKAGERDRRYAVTVASKLGSGGSNEAVRVVNLSANGCRFVSDHRLLIARKALTLRFGRADPVEGQVRWRIGKTHGVRFAHPLAPAVLDHIRLFLSEQPALTPERDASLA